MKADSTLLVLFVSISMLAFLAVCADPLADIIVNVLMAFMPDLGQQVSNLLQ